MNGVWLSEDADVIASRLALLNFVLDPFTYVLTRTQYRKELRDMCCKKKRPRFESVAASSNSRRISITVPEIGAAASEKTHQTAAAD